jgi:hypothetical protein
MTDKPFWMRLRDQKLKGGGKVEKETKLAKDSENSEAEEKENPVKKPTAGKPKQKRIKQASKKRAKQNRQYTPRKKKFLEEHPMCEMQMEGCTGIATELHHAAGRENARLLDVEDFKSACHSCHRKATDNSREAIADGHSKTRLGKPKR